MQEKGPNGTPTLPGTRRDYRSFALWFVGSPYEAGYDTVINSSSQKFLRVGSIDVPQRSPECESENKALSTPVSAFT